MLTHALAAAFLSQAAGALASAPETPPFGLESVGARFGVGANNTSVDFHKAEAVLKLQLPVGWDLGKAWQSVLRLDTSAGWLGDPGHQAFITSAGPCMLFRTPALPFSFEGGMSPTFLTRARFGSKDLGVPWQFVTYVGVNAEMGPSFRLSYQFEHMSNCGLSPHNPGLNMHLLGFSYKF